MATRAKTKAKAKAKRTTKKPTRTAKPAKTAKTGRAAKPAKAAGGAAKKAPTSSGKTVDGYVASLKDWRGGVISSLRELIRKAAPEATESIKWSQPVYEANGPFAYIRAFGKHVTFGFWRGTELDDPKGLLQGSGTRMSHLKLTGPQDIQQDLLQGWVRAAVELNRIKGNPAMRR